MGMSARKWYSTPSRDALGGARQWASRLSRQGKGISCAWSTRSLPRPTRARARTGSTPAAAPPHLRNPDASNTGHTISRHSASSTNSPNMPFGLAPGQTPHVPTKVPGKLTLGWALCLHNLPGQHILPRPVRRARSFAQIAVADGKGGASSSATRSAWIRRSGRAALSSSQGAHDYGGVVGRDMTQPYDPGWPHGHGQRNTGSNECVATCPAPCGRTSQACTTTPSPLANYFAAYMLPQMSGTDRLRPPELSREAPIGAIRRSVRDMEARALAHARLGLEPLRRARKLKPGHSSEIAKAKHGGRTLHLYTSSYSGAYFRFNWDSSLALAPALRTFAIEGNLSRFIWSAREKLGITFACLSWNPRRKTVTRERAATIDMNLLKNPALLALGDHARNRGTELPAGRPVLRLAKLRRTIKAGRFRMGCIGRPCRCWCLRLPATGSTRHCGPILRGAWRLALHYGRRFDDARDPL